jgi:hypothetical protein
MSTEGDFCHGTKVINPIQVGSVGCGVVATDEEIDGIGFSGTDRVCESAPYPGRGGGGTERIDIPDLIQADVALYEFGKLDGVAWFARVGHEEMGRERLDVVLV